jgi:YLP motif-containing protein 1
LVGSGKSYLAKALRDIEVENGGSAPRIHSIDDYFMIEVEKVSGIAFKLKSCVGPHLVLFIMLSFC